MNDCTLKGSFLFGLSKQMGCSTLINWTSPHQFYGLFGGIFIFVQILIEHSVSKQWRP